MTVHPRGATVRANVLAATLAELAEAGYAALTVEAVADRAGVHKTTVYRRWRDREALVIDALTDPNNAMVTRIAELTQRLKT